MLPKIKTDLAEQLSTIWQLDKAQLESLLEIPKSFDHGHLAFPVFFRAKELKKAPAVIAQEMAGLVENKLTEVSAVTAVSGFINFRLKASYLEHILFTAVANNQLQGLGFTQQGEGQTFLIDYSSPNVAKPMHVGHLRATVIGQALRNLAESQGYKVIGVNHLGDWGTQFGKLAWAYLEWGGSYDFEKDPIESLLALYVRFHDEAESNPELERQGAKTFKRLEDGDPEIQKIWKHIVELSLKDYERLWGILGVKHDLIRGESFFNDRLDKVVNELEEKGLLEVSEGAKVVFLDDQKMPPCLIQKSDGASLYATRDLACAEYRHDELKADMNVYVVGADQSLHFNQVFHVLKKMGHSWADQCVHVGFGMYRFKNVGKMSTRKGQIVRLSEILDKAIELVRALIEEKNPDLPNKERVIRQVAVGAVIFNDLVNDRVKDVEFDWEKALSFEGDSGPYVQYMHVRCQSILAKYQGEVPYEVPADLLNSEEEQQLIFHLIRYPDTLSTAFRQYKPHILSNYLLELCQSFSHFYHKNRVLGVDPELEKARLSLIRATQTVLKQGLAMLSIEAPEAM